MARRNWLWWLVVGLLAGCQSMPQPERFPEPRTTRALLPAAFITGEEYRH